MDARIVVRLWKSLASGELIAVGSPPNDIKRGIEKELWPALPKCDWSTSSAYNSKTGRRFDGIRVFSGKPIQSAQALKAKALALPYKQRIAVLCILDLWGAGGIPQHVAEKEWISAIQQRAAELHQNVPAERTIRTAKRWIKKTGETL